MKNIIYFNSLLLFLVLLVGLPSCKKDSLLDQTPPTQLNDVAFWKTTSDLQLYVNKFYSDGNIFPLYIEAFNYGPYQIDDNSDNMVNKQYNQRNNGQFTVSNNGGYADWTGIRNVNYFIVNFPRVLANGIPLSSAAPYIGEAYFFRAMYYFQALVNYGAVPWISEPLNTNDSIELYSNRLPRNVIADSIVKDLNTAISYLPVKSKAQTMRLYKEYAEGYKARVCLYEGTWEKYHANDPFGVSGQDGQDFIQMAADAADSVMSSGTFALDNVGKYDGYWKMFNQTDYSSSKEIMFWGAENYTINGGNSSENEYQGGSSSGGSGTGLSRSLVNDYLCTDGNPVAVSPLYEGDDSLSHIVANRDPRLAQTIEVPGDTIVVSTSGVPTLFTNPSLLSTLPCTTGFQLYKGLSTDPNTNPSNGRNAPVPGIIYMRYAEVLLIYAEAKAELGTITQSDLDRSINLLRDRVGMPHLILNNITTDPNWEFPGLSPIINEVRRERRVELACEGFRFNDICRWAAAGTLIRGALPLGAQIGQFLTANFGSTASPLYPQPGVNIFVNSQNYISPYANVSQMASGYQFNLGRDYLLPIDQQDALLTNTQNPGW